MDGASTSEQQDGTEKLEFESVSVVDSHAGQNSDGGAAVPDNHRSDGLSTSNVDASKNNEHSCRNSDSNENGSDRTPFDPVWDE